MNADLHAPLPRLSMRAMSWPASFYFEVRDKLDLNPPYQRGSVWDDARRRNLMRSLLMGLPIGSVVLNRRDHAPAPAGSTAAAHYIAVVDGKQRIETLRAVADGLAAWPPRNSSVRASERQLVDGQCSLEGGASGTCRPRRPSGEQELLDWSRMG